MRVVRNILFCIVTMLLFFPVPCIAASLQMSWNANTDRDLAGYLVYYGVRSGTYDAVYDVGNLTGYRITGVPNGTICYVAVSAYDTARNESALSAEQRVSVPAATPSDVPGITLVSPAMGATVSANPVLSWAAKGFSSFRVYLSISGRKYTRIYGGRNTSCSMQSTLWNWFIPSRTSLTWYVEGITSSRVVKSSTGSFIKR